MIFFIIFGLTRPFDYLYPGAGSRGLGMGSFWTIEDISAVYWNPSNTIIKNASFYVDLTRLVQYFNQYNIALGFNLYGLNITTSFNYFSSGDMPLNPELEDTILPESLGVFSVEEKVISLCLSKKWDFLRLGMNLKNYEQEIYKYHGIGYGIDLGVTFEYKFNFSFTAKDLFKTYITWFEKPIDTIFGSYIFAGSIPLKRGRFNLILEGSYILDKYERNFSIGSEICFNEIIYLRMGYSRHFSTGFGIKIKGIYINYALLLTDLEPTHSFGICLKNPKKEEWNER